MVIESFIGNDVIDQEHSFGSSQVITYLFNPVIYTIAWFCLNDVRMGPKSLSTLVCRVVSQGGVNDNNEIEMIEVLSLE